MLQNPQVLLTFDKMHNPLRLPRETTSERPKVVRTPRVCNILASEMCFAPQQRAFFRHRNFQTWSEPLVFLCILTSKFLFAPQRRALFRHLKKVARSWCVLYILTSKCASRHNGVHFFDISTSKSGPELVCF